MPYAPRVEHPALVGSDEAKVADREFFDGGVEGGCGGGEAIAFKHVLESCFADVVEAEKEEFGVF